MIILSNLKFNFSVIMAILLEKGECMSFKLNTSENIDFKMNIKMLEKDR